MSATNKIAILATCFSVFLGACQTGVPKEALSMSQVSVEKRERQTRYFETDNEAQILSASAGALQDLGFNIDESEVKLGVITGSKDRDATEAGQIVGAIIVGVLFGAIPPTDKKQKIRASLVTLPTKEGSKKMAVRITFQRTVWNTQNQVSKNELLDDPNLYTDFFSKLSNSVFLEAHEI